MLSAKKFASLTLLIVALAIVSNASGETATNNVWSKFETTRHGPFQKIRMASAGPLLPSPSRAWSHKALATSHRYCPFASGGCIHTCVIMDAPVKAWVRPGTGTSGYVITMTRGASRIMIDTETGIWLRCHTEELVQGPRGNYTWDLTYTIKDMSYGAAPDAALFKLPENLQEVKELTPWNDTRIKKQLGGKPAPDLQVTDIHGNPLSLSSFKGKTVLLDFWTTWCPPCQADASSIEKLNQKYGNSNLRIVGISVNEDRDTVEKYLKKHPHSYPVVLSSEN